MSDFRIKEPHLFVQLSQSLQQIEAIAPKVLSGVNSHLDRNIKAIFTDIKETENEIKDLKNQLREAQQSAENQSNSTSQNSNGINTELTQSIDSNGPSIDELRSQLSQKNQKLQELKNALSTLEHLKARFINKESQFNKTISDSKNAKQILNSFYEVGLKYVAFSNNNLNNSIDRNSQNGNQNNFKIFKDIERVGNTFHFRAKGGLSQSKVDEIEREIKNSSEKGNKISLDNISQSDFSMLEKNGYTIQKIDANDYSAYKNIKK
jgi:hypothetical protein